MVLRDEESHQILKDSCSVGDINVSKNLHSSWTP